jgi:hypothetical protein
VSRGEAFHHKAAASQLELAAKEAGVGPADYRINRKKPAFSGCASVTLFCPSTTVI